ncbi:MAG: AAA family ATPase [Oscillospiraceae bacterium]
MKTTKIEIHNLYGIKQLTLGGSSVELSGPKGAGKSSVLDSIRYALTNRSDRDFIIRQGSDEGEILIETDTGLSIDRKTRTTKADAVKVKEGNVMQTRPAEFLSGIFTPLQLNPVEFTQMSRQEKNRVILSLIEFNWDMNWIKEKFGEIPQGIDYGKHILEVLSDIQAENGAYFQSRQNLNRDIRNKQAFVEDIAKVIPQGYDAAKWDTFPIGDSYRRIERIKENNSLIDRAKSFKAGYDDKLRGIEAEKQIAISAAEKAIVGERQSLVGSIERLKAEIRAAEDKMSGLNDKLTHSCELAEAKAAEAVAKLDRDIGTAMKYAGAEKIDTSELQAQIDEAEAMRKHLNEYKRMVDMQKEVESLRGQTDEFTRKIELARELPSEILNQAAIPINGLTVENGVPLVNGRPVSNLSDGETLELCVQVAASRTGSLGIILIDGTEKLDSASREKLYAQCRDAGLQMIATRTTDEDGLLVTELWKD